MTIAGGLAERLFQAVAARDMIAALDLVRGELQHGQPVDSVLEALVAVQVEVGARWYSDEWSVADEHAATAIVDAALAVVEGFVGRAVPEGRPATVVVACPEGEWHGLPARMLATELRSLGADVVFLGSSMPADHLARYVDAHRPDIVALSVSSALSFGAAASAIDAVHDIGVPVVLGGRALGASEHRARSLGADGWSTDGAGVLAVPRRPGTSAAEAAARRHDRELAVLRLELDRPSLIEAAMHALAHHVPAVAGFDERQLAPTRENLDQIVRFAEASILVDDRSLFVESLDWLTPMLAARGVPAQAVEASLAALADVVTDDRLRTVMGVATS